MYNTTYIPCNSSNYNKGRTSAIKYLVIHYTANNGDTSIGNGNYFSKPNRNASAHYFVDEKTVVQSVKDEDTAWHCGAKNYKHKTCRNNNSIGIEMCSKKDKNGVYYIDEQTKNNAILLIVRLIKKYRIHIVNLIRHYDVTGKICPEPFVRNENEWIDFKKRVNNMFMEDSIPISFDKKEETNIMEIRYEKMEEIPSYAKPTIEKLVDKKIIFGDEKGKLDLSKDMLRIYVTLDRAGLFDK